MATQAFEEGAWLYGQWIEDVAQMIEHSSGCLLCGGDLVYSTEAVAMTCSLRGTNALSTAKCENGHFVCDGCHGACAMDVIERACVASESIEPIQLCTESMRSPAIHMHGPEHHFLVPAVLIATYDNRRGLPDLNARHLADAGSGLQRFRVGFAGRTAIAVRELEQGFFGVSHRALRRYRRTPGNRATE